MNRRLVILIAVAALLGVIYVWQGSGTDNGPVTQQAAPPVQTAQPAVAPAGGGGGAVNPLAADSPQAFAALFERPLFSPDRRGPAPADAGADASQADGDAPAFALVGIIVTPDGGGVLITSGGDASRADYIAKDASRDGWTLSEILPRSARFKREDGAEAELALPLPQNSFEGGEAAQ